jgi:hypothetical protein
MFGNFKKLLDKMFKRPDKRTYSPPMLIAQSVKQTGKRARIGLGKNKSNKQPCRRKSRQIGFKGNNKRSHTYL